MLFISASIDPRTVVFPHLLLINHGPDTAFPAWIFSHGLFEKKIEASYLCGIRVADQRHM
jgi:hypothetical protein